MWERWAALAGWWALSIANLPEDQVQSKTKLQSRGVLGANYVWRLGPRCGRVLQGQVTRVKALNQGHAEGNKKVSGDISQEELTWRGRSQAGTEVSSIHSGWMGMTLNKTGHTQGEVIFGGTVGSVCRPFQARFVDCGIVYSGWTFVGKCLAKHLKYGSSFPGRSAVHTSDPMGRERSDRNVHMHYLMKSSPPLFVAVYYSWHKWGNWAHIQTSQIKYRQHHPDFSWLPPLES